MPSFTLNSLLFFISSIFIGGEIFVKKWLLDFQFMSPYCLVGLIGVFTTIVCAILLIYHSIYESIKLIDTSSNNLSDLEVALIAIINIIV